MTKAKKAPVQKTELDRIVAQLRTMLRRDTTSAIEKGKLLLRSRELLADEHGQWMPWLAENFDMSYRSAINYCNAASYVAHKSKSATVADFASLSPTLLYRLAAGHFSEPQEAAILAEAKADKRVDEDAALAICDALEPDEPDDADDDADKAQPAEDSEIAAMLDGPPPDVPPPESVKPHDLRDLQLAHFDRIVTELLSHVTKPLADTEGTKHSDADLERLADFIATVRDRRAAQSAAAEAKANPVFAVFAKKVADQIHRVIVSHLTSKLTEVEKALALITEPEDRAALRRIDFALEQLSVGAATWRSRLTPKEPGAVPLKLLKKEP